MKKLGQKFATGIVKDIMFPGYGLADNVVEFIHNALLIWTVANVCINLVDSVEKVKTESYTPTGKFKIKEGNLIYITK